MVLTMHSDSVKNESAMDHRASSLSLLPLPRLIIFVIKLTSRDLKSWENEASEGNCKTHQYAVGALTLPN